MTTKVSIWIPWRKVLSWEEMEWYYSPKSPHEPITFKDLQELYPELSYEKALNIIEVLSEEYADVLVVLNEVMKITGVGYGVEVLRITDSDGDTIGDLPNDGIALEFINMGDTYVRTLGYDCINNVYLITSWGDFYEWLEQAYPPEQNEDDTDLE